MLGKINLKMAFHSENASNVLRSHYAGETKKHAEKLECILEGLGKSHRFRTATFSKCFFVYIKMQSRRFQIFPDLHFKLYCQPTSLYKIILFNITKLDKLVGCSRRDYLSFCFNHPFSVLTK